MAVVYSIVVAMYLVVMGKDASVTSVMATGVNNPGIQDINQMNHPEFNISDHFIY